MLLDGQNPDAIAAAAHALQQGHLLGLPTETVYGLAADAGNDAAVAKIFQAKGRPANHPLIVHVASAQDVWRFAAKVPDFAQRLLETFWPGPLTLILPRRPEVAAVAAAGQDSVGLRCPSHPVALAVLRAAQRLGVQGVAAPSANLFGRVSPTLAAHVLGEFGPSLTVIDGGACDVGIESTIVDCTRGAPVLLRPGVITPHQLSQACGVPVITPNQPDAQAPRASGTLDSHYAPSATVRLMSAAQLQQTLACDASLESSGVAIWACSPISVPADCIQRVRLKAMPHDPLQAAHDLFAQLRAFDAQGVREIWVETPPASPDWDGVRDRLTRAATPAR